jgi:hypothetical protein
MKDWNSQHLPQSCNSLNSTTYNVRKNLFNNECWSGYVFEMGLKASINDFTTEMWNRIRFNEQFIAPRKLTNLTLNVCILQKNCLFSEKLKLNVLHFSSVEYGLDKVSTRQKENFLSEHNTGSSILSS